MGSGTSSGSGWFGDPETNIPALLFPKHVLGLHASDDLAFHRDFEAVHVVSRRLMNNTANNPPYPDILNGGNGDLVNFHTPLFFDGFQSPNEYVALLCEAPFTLETTWKLIWEQRVSFVVTILTSEAKVRKNDLYGPIYRDSFHRLKNDCAKRCIFQDDLGTLSSDSKSFGDLVVGLYNEDILPDYTIRTMKV